jgi:hypothetical protein
MARKKAGPPTATETLPDGTLIEFWDSEDADGNKQTRRYLVNGQRLVSVTTIVDILAKHALLDWVERLTREGRRWWEVRNEAGERGDSSHHLLLQVLTGAGASLANLPDAHRPYGQGGFKWIRDRRPEVFEVERMVASSVHGYAGRLDLLAGIEDVRTLVDFKTVTKWSYLKDPDTKELTSEKYPPYAENLLQLDLYQGALIECGIEPAKRGLIVRLGPDAEFDETFVDLDPARGVGILAAYRAKSKAEAVLRKAGKAAHNRQTTEREIAEAVRQMESGGEAVPA